jgi:hypothetical protein
MWLVQTFQNQPNILPNEIGESLKPIEIPVFPILQSGFDPSYATIYSWLAFVGIILSIIIFAVFVLRLIGLAYKAITKGEEDSTLTDVYKKVRFNFLGLFIVFMTPLVLSLIGSLLGVGNIFQWPKMFSSCANSEYEFYFEAYLREGEVADRICL